MLEGRALDGRGRTVRPMSTTARSAFAIAATLLAEFDSLQAELASCFQEIADSLIDRVMGSDGDDGSPAREQPPPGAD